MKKFFFFAAVFWSIAFNISFSQVLSKVYILSEGGFSPNTSALSLFNNINNTFTPNIFNPGNLGLYPDGIILHQDNLFVTEQGNYGSNGKIYRLDTLGTLISSATAGINPYSLAIANNKIYITNGPASKVTVLNLNNLSFIRNIDVGVYPQEILAVGNKIFVANNSLFGGSSDSTVSVIDANTDSVVFKIIVKKDPSSLAITNDNHLLIGCPGDASKGIIYKVNINNYQIVDSFRVQVYGFDKDISVDRHSNKIFFISNTNNIVSLDLLNRNVTSIFTSTFPNNFYYGYAYDYINKRHYILDAKNFTVNGTLIITDSTGTVLNTFQTSVAPRRVLFKYVNPSSSIEEKLISDNFTLNQNYPNPFIISEGSSSKTKISWNSHLSGHTTLKVYDILGNEIATLVNDYKPAGYHEIDFYGNDINTLNYNLSNNNLASGIYFYRLTIGSESQVKKMIIRK